MVRIAVEPSAAGGGTERATLVATVLLDEVVAEEDLVRAIGQLVVALGGIVLVAFLGFLALGRLGSGGGSIGLRVADNEVAR